MHVEILPSILEDVGVGSDQIVGQSNTEPLVVGLLQKVLSSNLVAANHFAESEEMKCGCGSQKTACICTPRAFSFRYLNFLSCIFLWNFIFFICTTNKPVSKWVFHKQSEVRLHGRTGRFWTQLLCVLEDLVSKQQSANSSTGRGEGELKRFDRGCGQSVFVTFCSRQAVTLLILCGCFHLFPFWSSVNLSGIASRFN